MILRNLRSGRELCRSRSWLHWNEGDCIKVPQKKQSISQCRRKKLSQELFFFSSSQDYSGASRKAQKFLKILLLIFTLPQPNMLETTSRVSLQALILPSQVSVEFPSAPVWNLRWEESGTCHSFVLLGTDRVLRDLFLVSTSHLGKLQMLLQLKFCSNEGSPHRSNDACP